MKVASEAKKVIGAALTTFMHHTQKILRKNSIVPYTKKVAYMKKMFPKHAKNIIVDKARNVFEIAVSLHNKGHRSIIMVIGSDRVAEFEKLLNTYNGVEARHGYYGFDNIEVISIGEKISDAEGVTGMSASKMRGQAHLQMILVQFKLGLPSGFRQGMSLFKDVRKYMGIRESFITHQVEQTEEDVIRRWHIEGEIFTIGEEVTDTYTGVTGKIIRRGTNYVTFVAENGETYKKWLYEAELTESLWANIHKKRQRIKQGSGEKMRKWREKAHQLQNQKRAKGEEKDIDERKTAQDKEVGDRKGTQPKKYYAKDVEIDDMAKSTKQSRARHFEKGASMDDDNSDAYKPAAQAISLQRLNHPKYTQAMKKKFPDLYKENKRIPREKGQHRNSSSHSGFIHR